jgi:hypothetical protein
MNEKQTQQIRELVQQGQYDVARKLLVMIRDTDPDARQWLNTLDDIIAQRSDMPPKGKNENKRGSVKRWTSDRIIANVIISLIYVAFFGLMAGGLVIVIFWLYDVAINSPKRTNNELLVSTILMSALGVGIRAISSL